MMIIETCPICGNPVTDEIICTFPPIPAKRCFNCGWCWEGKPEPVKYVSFGENGCIKTNDVERE